MQPYIRPHSEGHRYLRALMKSALPLLSTTSASRAVFQNRVWGSRSDLSCYQLNHTSHRAVGFLSLASVPSPLSLSSLFPGKILDDQCLWMLLQSPPIRAIAPARDSNWHAPDRCLLDSATPTRSGHSCSPPPLPCGSNRDAQATLESTGCDRPF